MTVWLALSANAQQVRVMQWNIQGHLGTLAENTTSNAEAIARIVNYHQPDILLFNEIQSRNIVTNAAALTDWVTNNVPYLGTNFYVAISTITDGFERNGAISPYPIVNETTYDDGLRGLHSFQVVLPSTNLQIFHTHLKCCHSLTNSPTDCERRQTEAEFDAATISAWAATNSLPYIMAGDWNEDQSNSFCGVTATYHPVTTIIQGAQLIDFVPTDLNGKAKTQPSVAPTYRYDYCLAASNRLAAVSGLVFNSRVWAQAGLYTNVSPQHLTNDTVLASDHCPVFVNYDFPPPLLLITGLANGSVDLSFASLSNRLYTLETTGVLTTNTSWQPLPDFLLIPGTGTLLDYIDPTAAPQRFYRLHVQVTP